MQFSARLHVAACVLLCVCTQIGISDERDAPDANGAVPPSLPSEPPTMKPDNSEGILLAQGAPAASQSLGGQASAGSSPVSEAERIARLQRSLETDSQTLQEIQSQLDSPTSEYRQAEAGFQRLDSQLIELKQELSALPEAERESLTQRRQEELDKLQVQWNLAKDRFDIAIEERKTRQQMVATLSQKIQQNHEALNRLTGSGPIGNVSASSAATTTDREAQLPPAAAPHPTGPPADVSAAGHPADAPGSRETVASENAATPSAAAPTAAASVEPGATTAPPSKSPPVAPEPGKPVDEELQKATEEAEFQEAAAQTAELEAHSVAQRMSLLQKDIELERKLLATARKKSDNSEATLSGLEEEYRTQAERGAEAAALRDLQTKISASRGRAREARAEGRQRSARLDELQSQYAALQAEQIVAMREAEQSRQRADTAKEKVDYLNNPFTIRNTLQWLIDHGPRLLIIVLAMGAALAVSRVAEKRIVDAMVKRGGLGKKGERENRARTLVSVFHNAANVAILGGGLLMILDIVGAPITALMGGAAVFGLAIAFGAQNLIKDYFYGFMILLEQQYTINDVVRIGDIAGQVERITLRMTVLRDLEGRVHFIPHGQITSTTNMTHGWSRAVFDIGVAYKEDADRVIGIIKQLGEELRADPAYRPLILEDLTMLGVDALGDSAVVIKFFITTRPLKQWEIKRELLRRIKRTFDEQGIEIPFPHRTVYHRQEAADGTNLRGEDGVDWSHRRSA